MDALLARQRPASRPVVPAADPSGSRIPWLAVAVLITAGAAAYANALGGPLLLDDQRTLRQNTSIQQISRLSEVLHPPVQSPVTGRPVPNLSLAINYAMSGDSLRGYRVLNISVHILAALALFGLLRRTLPRMLGATPVPRPAPTPHLDGVALAAAAIWLVHPLNSEAVNYLTQRTESLMGLFFVAALWASARALDTRRPLGWEVAAMAAAFCAVGSKETALTLPLVLVVWDRAFAFESFTAAWAARKRLYGLVTASWLLFAYFAASLPFFAEKGFQEYVSRWAYLLHQGPMILRYLGLTVWPHALVFDYGAPGPLTLGAAAPGVLIVAVLVMAALVALILWPRVGFWGAWFFITLAPASSLIPIPTEVGAERRMYLPLMALTLLLVLAARWALGRVVAAPLRTRISWAATGVVVLALGATTVARNRDYQDALRLWQTSLDRWPQPRAHEHLSMALRDAGRMEESVAHLRTAAPGSPNARHALASALLERGELTESIAQFKEYIRLRPDDPNIILGREELAVAQMRAGDAAGAAEQFRAIIALDPRYARARVGLGDTLVQMNQPGAALDAFTEAVRLQPTNLVALINLAMLKAGAGDTSGAITSLRSALAVEPRHIAARQQLIDLLLRRGDVAAVEAEARLLVGYTPQDANAYNVLGIALASQKRFGPARDAFETALRLDPNHRQARENLAPLTQP
ncbi:MAG: tetratricopeptide repeat protein [Vicinamibacterales bacterium]